MTTPDLTLTASQANHLDVMAAHGGIRGYNAFVPEGRPPLGMTSILNRLEARGFATSGDWDGSTFRYWITPDGAAALIAHAS